MRNFRKRKGNSLVEYALIAVLVGLLMTGLMMLDSSNDPGQADKSKYKTYFKNSFVGSTGSGTAITIGPLGE